MEHVCKLVLFILVLMAVLHDSFGEKKGFWGKKKPSKKPSVNPSQGSKTQPPIQPSYTGEGNNPDYPNQQYPGGGGSNPGGYPNQNPGAGGFSNQYPSRSEYSLSFQFRGPQEEHQYNNHMYQQQGTHSKGKNNKGGPRYTPGTRLPPKAQSFDQFMNACMKRMDLLKEQNMKESAVHNSIQRGEPLTDYLGTNESFLVKGEPEKNDTTDYPKIYKNEDNDTVSIEQIGYPALIEQIKVQKCVQLYLVHSESFLEKEEKKSNRNKSSSNHNGQRVSGVLLVLITSIMLLRST